MPNKDKEIFDFLSEKIKSTEDSFRENHLFPPYSAFLGFKDWQRFQRYGVQTKKISISEEDGFIQFSGTQIYALLINPGKFLIYPCDPTVVNIEENQSEQ